MYRTISNMATLCIRCLLHSPLERSNQHSKDCSIVVIIYLHRIMSIRFLKIISNPVYMLPPQFVCNICEVQNIIDVRSKNSVAFADSVRKLVFYLIPPDFVFRMFWWNHFSIAKYRYRINNATLLSKVCYI